MGTGKSNYQDYQVELFHDSDNYGGYPWCYVISKDSNILIKRCYDDSLSNTLYSIAQFIYNAESKSINEDIEKNTTNRLTDHEGDKLCRELRYSDLYEEDPYFRYDTKTGLISCDSYLSDNDVRRVTNYIRNICYDTLDLIVDVHFERTGGWRVIPIRYVNESLKESVNLSKLKNILEESVNSDIVSMIKKQFPKATIKTFVRKHSNVHKSSPDSPRGKLKYVDIRITPDSTSSVNSILQYCNHNLKKILDSDNRFYYYGDTPARNPRGSKEVILSYEDYSDLSDDEYSSLLGESKSIKDSLKEEFKKQLQDELYNAATKVLLEPS